MLSNMQVPSQAECVSNQTPDSQDLSSQVYSKEGREQWPAPRARLFCRKRVFSLKCTFERLHAPSKLGRGANLAMDSSLRYHVSTRTHTHRHACTHARRRHARCVGWQRTASLIARPPSASLAFPAAAVAVYHLPERQTDKQTDGQTDRQTDRQTD